MDLPIIPNNLEFKWIFPQHKDNFYEVCAKTTFAEGESIENIVLGTTLEYGVFTSYIDILGSSGRVTISGSNCTDSATKEDVQISQQIEKLYGKSLVVVAAGASNLKYNNLMLKGKDEFYLNIVVTKGLNLTVIATNNTTFKALTAVLQGGVCD